MEKGTAATHKTGLLKPKYKYFNKNCPRQQSKKEINIQEIFLYLLLELINVK
jgi:hypothetical protein